MSCEYEWREGRREREGEREGERERDERGREGDLCKNKGREIGTEG